MVSFSVRFLFLDFLSASLLVRVLIGSLLTLNDSLLTSNDSLLLAFDVSLLLAFESEIIGLSIYSEVQ